MFLNLTCQSRHRNQLGFCQTQGCQEPAFCSDTLCYTNHRHQPLEVNKPKAWSEVAAHLETVLKNSVSQQELNALERQQDELRFLICQLEDLVRRHQRAIEQTTNRVQLYSTVQKLLWKVKTHNTDDITGGDMAKIMQALVQEGVFKPKGQPTDQLSNRVWFTEQLLQQLRSGIRQFETLEHNHSIKHSDKLELRKVIPEIHITPKTANLFIISDGLVCGKQNDSAYWPIFLNKPLEGKESFEVELVNIGASTLMIGVASEDLKDCGDCYGHQDSICIDAYEGCLLSSGVWKPLSFSLNTGDKILVTVDTKVGTVEWQFTNRNMKHICRENISAALREKPLYPVVHLSGCATDKIRYI